MKIVFTSKGKNWESEMDERFGRTAFLISFDEESKMLSFVDNTAIQNEAHGAGPLTVQKLLELKPDVLITGNGPGKNAATLLSNTGIDIYTGASDMIVKDAYTAFKSNSLTKI